MRIYRWDLDKTYLLTDFDSFAGLVRSATEPASAKQAVPGAPMLLRALSNDAESRIFFVSGSPTQLQDVLEEKLRMDGVTFERLTLKDNLGNLRRGRVRAIRGQFGYKLPQLLRDRVGEERGARETLFGDDAEIDAVVYCVYADAVSGRISPRELSRIMQKAGAYADDIEQAMTALQRIPRTPLKERMFIRLERRRPVRDFAPLGTRVFPVHSWWQAALVLVADGDLQPADAVAVAASVFEDDPDAGWKVAAQVQDVMRRGGIGVEHIAALPLPEAWQHRVEAAVKQCGVACAFQRRGPPEVVPDYAAILSTWSKSAKEHRTRSSEA